MASVMINKSRGTAVALHTAWSDVEVRALIAICEEQGCFHRNNNYQKEEGYTRDAEQCRNNIKNIYREIKDNNKETITIRKQEGVERLASFTAN